VDVTITCSGGVSACRGTVTLSTLAARRSANTSAPSRLAAGTFTIAAGHSRTIALRLTRHARLLLSSGQRLRVMVAVRAISGVGGAELRTVAATLRSRCFAASGRRCS
jgi:hypothetical protein